MNIQSPIKRKTIQFNDIDCKKLDNIVVMFEYGYTSVIMYAIVRLL